jgi:hypothetical protein
MIRIQVRLTPEQVCALQHLAKQEGKSVVELIRLSVDAMLRTNQTIDQKVRWEKAIAAAGKLHCSFEGLSTHHDRYLIESFDALERNHAG